MRTKTKALALALCAVLLVVSTVFVTMAYLTSQDTVTNTFTVGRVGITLDEAEVKPDGTYAADESTRTYANVYHLIPGHTYIKDPVIHVDADSEDCWLFVMLENGLIDIIAGQTDVNDKDPDNTVYTIEAQMAKNGWTLVKGTTNVYAYGETCSAGADVATFATFTLKGDDANVSAYGEASIVVTAYAVQADGFDNAQEAWTATFGAPNNG